MIDSFAEANNLDRETAGKYAARIGDTPALDKETVLVVVEDDNGNAISRR